jgi:hypothetical protein
MENTGQPGEQLSTQDFVNASLIFAKALDLILKEGEGIVCNIPQGASLNEETKKVIVFKKDGQIQIYKSEQDFEEGTPVNLNGE